MTDRFAGWGRGPSAIVLGVVGILLVWGLAAGSFDSSGFIVSDPDRTDIALYTAISDRVTEGENYYEAAASEQAERGYPTTPAMTVREPTLAWLDAALGHNVMFGILIALSLAALVVSAPSLERIAPGRISWMVSVLIVAFTLALLCTADLARLHEVWAGILLFAGLMCVGKLRGGVTVALVTAASLIRELVTPVTGLLVLFAVRRRRRNEVMIGLIGLVSAATFYTWHFTQASTIASDGLESPGWLGLHGWAFLTNALWFSTPLQALPLVVTSIVLPFALLGWCSRRGAVSDAVAAVLLSYTVIFGIVGRTDNLYWGFLLGVTMLPGLAFAPRAIVLLMSSVFGHRGNRDQRATVRRLG